jgi:hypothetical protein
MGAPPFCGRLSGCHGPAAQTSQLSAAPPPGEPRALAVETHEEWIDGSRYLIMEPLRELLRKPVPERKAA